MLGMENKGIEMREPTENEMIEGIAAGVEKAFEKVLDDAFMSPMYGFDFGLRVRDMLLSAISKGVEAATKDKTPNV